MEKPGTRSPTSLVLLKSSTTGRQFCIARANEQCADRWCGLLQLVQLGSAVGADGRFCSRRGAALPASVRQVQRTDPHADDDATLPDAPELSASEPMADSIEVTLFCRRAPLAAPVTFLSIFVTVPARSELIRRREELPQAGREARGHRRRSPTRAPDRRSRTRRSSSRAARACRSKPATHRSSACLPNQVASSFGPR